MQGFKEHFSNLATLDKKTIPWKQVSLTGRKRDIIYK